MLQGQCTFTPTATEGRSPSFRLLWCQRANRAHSHRRKQPLPPTPRVLKGQSHPQPLKQTTVTSNYRGVTGPVHIHTHSHRSKQPLPPTSVMLQGQCTVTPTATEANNRYLQLLWCYRASAHSHPQPQKETTVTSNFCDVTGPVHIHTHSHRRKQPLPPTSVMLQGQCTFTPTATEGNNRYLQLLWCYRASAHSHTASLA